MSTEYEYDAAGRRITETTTDTSTFPSTVTTVTKHYSDDGDNPSWIETQTSGGTKISRYVDGLAGGVSAQVIDGEASLALADLSGSIVTTVTIPNSEDAAGINGWNHFDEFGNSLPWTAEQLEANFPWTLVRGETSVTITGTTVDTGAGNYGWLGEHERAVTDIGITLMGARLYNPITARFTSLDPVAGGNENAYVYPQDPINSQDITGEYSMKFLLFKRWGVLNTAAKLMRAVQKILPELFPLTGAPVLTPGKNKGMKFELSPDPLGLTFAALKVRSVKSTSFSFDTNVLHLEAPGRITFSIKVRARFFWLHVDSSSNAWWMKGRLKDLWTEKAARPNWQQFADNIRSKFAPKYLR